MKIIIKNQQERLNNDEKILMKLFNPKKLEQKNESSRKLKTFKVFNDFDVDFEIPEDLTFLEETKVANNLQEKDILKVVSESKPNEEKENNELEKFFEKLNKIEKFIGRKYAINYLKEFLETHKISLNSSNESYMLNAM